MKLISVFLFGGITAIIIYYVLHCRFNFLEIFLNYIKNNSANFINLFAILVAICIAVYQIKTSLEEGNKQQKIEWAYKIYDTVSSLRALRDELEHNLNIYEKYILPNRTLYESGKAYHQSEYSIRALEFNLEKNAFEYDTTLQKRVLFFYSFLEEANRVFQQAKNPAFTTQVISDFYTQIFFQHTANLSEWKKIIQDLSRYSNDYEAFSSKASINSLQALTNGTILAACIAPEKNKLVLINIGGETATDVKVKFDFPSTPEEDKKFIFSFLSTRQPIEYLLDNPRNDKESFQGKCVISYQSEHSNGYRNISFDVKWDTTKKNWVQTSNQELINKGYCGATLGSINDASIYQIPKQLPADIVVKLDSQGKALLIKNQGGTSISMLKIIKEFGEIENWEDFTPQYMLEPNEEILLHMPKQSKTGSSFGGKVIFQSEGSDYINYKILSFSWDHLSLKWTNN